MLDCLLSRAEKQLVQNRKDKCRRKKRGHKRGQRAYAVNVKSPRNTDGKCRRCRKYGRHTPERPRRKRRKYKGGRKYGRVRQTAYYSCRNAPHDPPPAADIKSQEHRAERRQRDTVHLYLPCRVYCAKAQERCRKTGKFCIRHRTVEYPVGKYDRGGRDDHSEDSSVQIVIQKSSLDKLIYSYYKDSHAGGRHSEKYVLCKKLRGNLRHSKYPVIFFGSGHIHGKSYEYSYDKRRKVRAHPDHGLVALYCGQADTRQNIGCFLICRAKQSHTERVRAKRKTAYSKKVSQKRPEKSLRYLGNHLPYACPALPCLLTLICIFKRTGIHCANILSLVGIHSFIIPFTLSFEKISVKIFYITASAIFVEVGTADSILSLTKSVTQHSATPIYLISHFLILNI